MLGFLFTDAVSTALAQSSPAPVRTPPRRSDITPVSAETFDEFAEMLRGLERRVDILARQNEELLRENQRVSHRLNPSSFAVQKDRDPLEIPSQDFRIHQPERGLLEPSGPVPHPFHYDGTHRPTEFEHIGYTNPVGHHGEESPPAAGGGSKAAGGDPTTTGRAQEVGNRHRGKLTLKPYYDFDGDGFKFVTEDGEYSFGVRGMVQVDGKVFSDPVPGGIASDGIYNPRSRFYLEGNLSKPIQYEFSFQQTYDSVGLLDAYLNFNYDPAFQVRIGRYKTPFTYEWYRIHIWDLLAPERSLFATNYEGQRRFGAMVWGTAAENRVEYAVGTFNTQRNGYQPFHNLQDMMAFVNLKPFYNEDRGFALRDLQFGGSVNAGYENQPTAPTALRTNNAPTAAAFGDSGAVNFASLPFLAFTPGVTEHGSRALWEVHSAWYYGGLTLLGAYEGGSESYATATGSRSRIPLSGWFAQAGYLITGETIRDRTLVDPIHPFDLRPGRVGFGAFEPTARYSEMTLDQRVFTEGLADPKLWTNQARLVDVGVNWYINKFVKIYFDWEHAMFATPVTTGKGGVTQSNDLFWIRSQLYF
ncbi:OprO/OprP family phosphate-selective porin [Schlesneria sp. T3-172]|uniref:OprO/OprP family phosphate-selective porin n=1 Tax=Schlesneria sphaerica TaxID=3373610 RepID=UPI0037CC5BE3